MDEVFAAAALVVRAKGRRLRGDVVKRRPMTAMTATIRIREHRCHINALLFRIPLTEAHWPCILAMSYAGSYSDQTPAALGIRIRMPLITGARFQQRIGEKCRLSFG